MKSESEAESELEPGSAFASVSVNLSDPVLELFVQNQTSSNGFGLLVRKGEEERNRVSSDWLQLKYCVANFLPCLKSTIQNLKQHQQQRQQQQQQ